MAPLPLTVPQAEAVHPPERVQLTTLEPATVAVTEKLCPASMVTALLERLVIPPPAYPPDPHPTTMIVMPTSRSIVTNHVSGCSISLKPRLSID